MNTTLLLRVFDSSDDLLSGDAANVTVSYSTDQGATFSAVLGSVAESGVGGLYTVALTNAEADVNHRYTAASSTSGAYVLIDPASLPRERSTPAPSLSAPVAVQKRTWSALAQVLEADEGEDVDFTLSVVGGADLETKTVTIANDFNGNLNSTTISVGCDFDVASSYEDGELEVTVAASAGSTATVSDSGLFAPDPEFGCAPRWFDSAHSGPTAMVHPVTGQLWQVCTSAGEARRFLSVDRQPAGEIFSDVPTSKREPQDKYHSGVAITYADGRVVAASTDHNQRVYLIVGKTPEELVNAHRLGVTGDGGADYATYVQLAGEPEAGGRCWLMTRFNDRGTLYEFSDLDKTTPTVVTEVLTSDTQRTYPRGVHRLLKDDGTTLLAITAQERDGTHWSATWLALYDPDTRQAYNARGETCGGTALGTTGTPKLSDALAVTGSHATTGAVVISPASVSTQRYTMPVGVNVKEWNASTKEARYALVYHDSDDTSSAAEVSGTIGTDRFATLIAFDGTTRVVASGGNNPLGINNSDSYRLTGFLKLVDSNLTAYVGSRDAAFTAADDYNQFGCDRASVFVGDIDGVTNATELEAAISERQTLTVTSDWGVEIRPVANSDGLILGEAIEGSHIDDTQGVSRWLRYGVPERSTAAQALTAVATDVTSTLTQATTAATQATTAATQATTAATQATTAATQATTASTAATAAQTAAEAVQTTVTPDIALRVTTSGTSLVVDAYRATGNITTAGLRVDRISTGEYEPGIPVVPGAVGSQTYQATYANKSAWADERLMLTLTGTTDSGSFTYVCYHEPVEQTKAAVEVSGGGGTVTAEDIDERITWTFPRNGSATTAANIVRCKVGSAFTAQFDLDGVIEADAVISGTPTVASTGPTAGTVVVHTSKRRANVPLSDIDTAGTYSITLTYTTTTSQTLVVSGTLVVEAA